CRGTGPRSPSERPSGGESGLRIGAGLRHSHRGCRASGMRPAAALTFLLALGCNDDEVVRPPHIQSTALQCGSDADEPCWCGDTKGVLPCSQGGGEMVCDCSAIAEL